MFSALSLSRGVTRVALGSEQSVAAPVVRSCLTVRSWASVFTPACIVRVEDLARRQRSTVSTFRVPSYVARSMPDFPHCAHPICFTEPLMGPSCWGNFRPVASHSIGVTASSVRHPPPMSIVPSRSPFGGGLSPVPKPHDGSASPLTYRSPSHVLHINGRLVIPPRPWPPLMWRRCNGRPFAPQTLLRLSLLRTIATALVFGRLPVSPVITGLPCSDDFAPVRGGPFSSCLASPWFTSASLPPAEASSVSSVFVCSCGFALRFEGSALGDTLVRCPMRSLFVTARLL